MKILHPRKQNHALTLVEVLIVLAVIAILVALVFPALARAKAKAIRISCVSNLKQTVMSFIVWAGDNRGSFPMAVASTNGGTMEFITGPNAFRHFQVMSNELAAPTVIACPSESLEFQKAINFTDINNSNISFFVGIDANKATAQMILVGDRNITNGAALKNGLLELTANRPASWTTEMHNKVGNIALADGSVQQVSITGLQNAVASTGLATNRLQMPILGP